MVVEPIICRPLATISFNGVISDNIIATQFIFILYTRSEIKRPICFGA